ncbi:MAG TPA: hypothetical protein VI146_04195, partial [Nitrososphaeraceae archaeon]
SWSYFSNEYLQLLHSQTQFWDEINFYHLENLIQILQNNLTDTQQYKSPYEIEKEAGLLQEK